jgi:hypothetical protein
MGGNFHSYVRNRGTIRVEIILLLFLPPVQHNGTTSLGIDQSINQKTSTFFAPTKQAISSMEERTS